MGGNCLWGNYPEGNFIRGNCPGVVFQEEFFRCICPGGECPGLIVLGGILWGLLSGGQLSRGEVRTTPEASVWGHLQNL